MSIKLDIKTSVVDTNTKVDSVDVNASKYQNDAAEVEALLEDMPGMETITNGHEYTGYDDYMCGDMNPEAIQETTVSMPSLRDFPPSLDDLIAMNPKVRQNLELVIDHYGRTEEKIKEFIDHLKDLQFTGQLTADEASRISQKIEMYNGSANRCQIEAQKAQTMLDGDYEIYRKEFRMGDLNDDGWIGKPYTDGALGVQTLDNGRKIYINPTTGVAYDHPPYADLEYEPILGRGYDIVDPAAEGYVGPLGEGVASPTTDLEIYVSDLNALQGSAFGTPAELMGMQYLWVEADGEKSFEPKLAFQPDQTDSDTDTEPHYEIAGFEKVGDQIVQKMPEGDDIQKYVQVEVGEITATSREVDGGKGYVHYIEYYSADASHTLIARICIRETKVDGQIPASTSELYAKMPDNFFQIDKESKNWAEYILTDEEQVEIVNAAMAELGLSDTLTVNEWEDMGYLERKAYLMARGDHKVYASSSALAFNTDNIYSYGMKADFSGIKSTARLTTSLEQLEQALNLTRPPESDEKAYRAYMENLSAFTDTSRMWAAHANKYRNPDDQWDYHTSTHDREWNWKYDTEWVQIERNFNSGGYASVYLDPATPEAQAQTFNHFGRDVAGDLDFQHDGQIDFINLVDPPESWRYGEHPVTETMSSQITGVVVYGKGRLGHYVGTEEYNDIFHVAEKNARLDELKERFDWAEPIMPESAFNNSVIECGNGNDIVRGYDANHYITGVTMAVIDGGGTSDNYIEAQAPTERTGDYFTHKPDWRASVKKYGRNKEEFILDVNSKHYVHVDAGGVVALDTHFEEEKNDIIDVEWNPEGDGNPMEGYYEDDHYDIASSTEIHVGQVEDPDIIEGVGEMASGTNDLGDENAIRNALEEIAAEIATERQRVEIPDYIESAAQEWMTQYGGHTQEMQDEMDGFFGSVFGEIDSLWGELADEELSDEMGSPDEDDFMNTTV